MSLEELWTLTRKIFVDAGLLDKNLPPDSPILRNCYRSLSRKQARWGGPRTNGNGRTHPA
jgi:hypothetical protein